MCCEKLRFNKLRVQKKNHKTDFTACLYLIYYDTLQSFSNINLLNFFQAYKKNYIPKSICL